MQQFDSESSVFYNKVEISGISTSSLKTLKEQEKQDLLHRTRAGDMQARDDLIKGNLRLVLSVIQKFIARDNADDLFQVGVIGLIKAVDNFDTSLNVKFSTYAVPMILGEIKRYLRDNAHVRVSRSIRDNAYKALQARERLMEADPQRSSEPTYDELAKELGISREDVLIAMESIAEPVSLYEPVYTDGGDTIYVMDQIGDSNDDNVWVEKIALNNAFKSLSDREKNILSLRYYVGKTQIEVAERIGISQAQVSRLEKTALAKMRRKL
ncbi:MAG: RNA polymerase sporulation sigma factor SigG [Oscillospiraceae bacterium]|jgi:RNA polymerase sporulation-specific sigma factor|nr:RNA polymerase sporulation sigma factor SigG [Oscillospiraceae bacterium]